MKNKTKLMSTKLFVSCKNWKEIRIAFDVRLKCSVLGIIWMVFALDHRWSRFVDVVARMMCFRKNVQSLFLLVGELINFLILTRTAKQNCFWFLFLSIDFVCSGCGFCLASIEYISLNTHYTLCVCTISKK